MSTRKEPLVPCPAGCGYSVLLSKCGLPHKILVADQWITCPGR